MFMQSIFKITLGFNQEARKLPKKVVFLFRPIMTEWRVVVFCQVTLFVQQLMKLNLMQMFRNFGISQR